MLVKFRCNAKAWRESSSRHSFARSLQAFYFALLLLPNNAASHEGQSVNVDLGPIAYVQAALEPPIQLSLYSNLKIPKPKQGKDGLRCRFISSINKNAAIQRGTIVIQNESSREKWAQQDSNLRLSLNIKSPNGSKMR